MQSQLFQRAENGDSEAQAKLYEQYFRQTYRVAHSFLHHMEDAEEVAQDVLAYALTHLGQYDPVRGAFTTWLYTMTLNRCRNKRRRKQLAQIPLFSWLMGETKDTAVPDHNPAHQFNQQARDEALHAAIEALPSKQREAITLRYFHEMGYEEIGKIVGCSTSTAQSRVWIGQKKLYALLAGGLADERVN